MSSLVIVAIGTDVGKTVVSAILTKALDAIYWKPVQAGDLDNSDSKKIQGWLGKDVVIAEKFRLKTPASPHHAANIDGLEIRLEDLNIPETDKNLVIETAGGVMVPLNNEGLLYVDIINNWNLPVVLVSRHYLGSINHTLLTVEALKNRGIKIKGLIFIGEENKSTEEIIEKNTQLKVLHRIPIVETISQEFIVEQAGILKAKWE